MSLKFIVYVVMLFSVISCVNKHLYETPYFRLLLSTDVWLKETVSIADKGFLSYELKGQDAPPHSVMLLYPQEIDPELFLKERYNDNPLINIRPIIQFSFGKNKGVMRRYNNSVLTLESYCFNKDGWTILIGVSDNSSKFKKPDQLIYSFEILRPL